MTGQPAIYVGLFFVMTRDAKAHLEIHVFEPVHGFHRTVTFLTGNLFFDMPLVIEKNMFRQIIDLSPRQRGPGIEIPVYLLNLGMIGDNVFMTVETLFHRRYPRKG